tara:strand:+ start:430 stop:1101 length:672 start_codon:yes stop_codon:yes gene_type:complete
MLSINFKFAQIWKLFFSRIIDLLIKINHYKNYRLYDVWDFVYMSYDLSKNNLRFQNKYQDSIFIAERKDLDKIETDLYPKMDSNYNLRYFKRLNEIGLDCFLCEQDGKLIHYSWLFYDLLLSPLAKTPMGEFDFGGNIVFWGPTFTVPEARGITYPYIFSKIVKFLKKNKKYDYLIIFAYKKNRGAIPFYKRLGFIELQHQPQPPFYIRILRSFDTFFNSHKK